MKKEKNIYVLNEFKENLLKYENNERKWINGNLIDKNVKVGDLIHFVDISNNGKEFKNYEFNLYIITDICKENCFCEFGENSMTIISIEKYMMI